jgi:hypothetical protein
VRHPIVQSEDGRVEIRIPDGKVEKCDDGRSTHYLYIQDQGSPIATISGRREIRKLMNLCNKILQTSCSPTKTKTEGE